MVKRSKRATLRTCRWYPSAKSRRWPNARSVRGKERTITVACVRSKKLIATMVVTRCIALISETTGRTIIVGAPQGSEAATNGSMTSIMR